jgi:hypothetical protein
MKGSKSASPERQCFPNFSRLRFRAFNEVIIRLTPSHLHYTLSGINDNKRTHSNVLFEKLMVTQKLCARIHGGTQTDGV